jgi:CheY-like chemotaxis protein
MRTLLVVEDSTVVRRHLVSLLQRDFCETLEASDGEEALHLLTSKKVDGIFLDLSMPRMGGLEFLKQLRTSARATPVVLITSSYDRDEISEALRLGTHGYLLKPFTPELVRTALRQATGYDVNLLNVDPPNIALVDLDEETAQELRSAVPAIGRVEQFTSIEHLATLGADWCAVVIGSLGSEASHDVEALSEVVWSEASDAARIRLAHVDAVLPIDTTFHDLTTHADLTNAVAAVLSGLSMWYGDTVRARQLLDGPHAPLSWNVVEASLARALRQIAKTRTEAVINLRSLPPRFPARFLERLDRVAETLMIRVTYQLPDGFDGAQLASLGV